MKQIQNSALIDTGITIVILMGMKTAISIPEPIFKTADRLAKRLGMSRSELYVRAISNYVEEHSGQKVTELLNQVYQDTEMNELESRFNQAQLKSIPKEQW